MLRISQGHLNLLSTCPRKFQHVVLDQLGTLDGSDQQERLLQGAQFHRLLQQWLMALPVEPVLQQDEQLQQWFASFQAASPQILGDGIQQPECDRLLEFEGYLLTARYDLLITDPDHAKILDWKTYPRPQAPQRLEQHWQTRLYPFILAETSAYRPEQISMVYWFFQADQAGGAAQSWIFQYDHHKHEETRRELRPLLHQLTQGLAHYQAGEPFSQLHWGAAACAQCAFASRCGRIPVDLDDSLQDAEEINRSDRLFALSSLAEIAEVPL
jgi:hypothetical protein